LEPEIEQVEADLRELLHQTYMLAPERLAVLESGIALFGDGLGLDSLDSMPLVIAIEERFGITLHNDTATRKAFASLGGLARYLAALLAARSG
jgi:acyl carrier protein